MWLAASILVFALLMAIRDEVPNMYLRMLIAGAAGASLALVRLKSKSTRTQLPPASIDGVARPQLWIATGGYAISWFLPVIKEGWTLDRGLLGWQAFTTVMSPLWDFQTLSERPWFSLLSVASGLTNVFMVIALIRLHLRQAPNARRWLWGTSACAAINASWIGFDWHDQQFQVGYFAWLLSFVFLAVALMPRSWRASREVQPSATGAS